MSTRSRRLPFIHHVRCLPFRQERRERGAPFVVAPRWARSGRREDRPRRCGRAFRRATDALRRRRWRWRRRRGRRQWPGARPHVRLPIRVRNGCGFRSTTTVRIIDAHFARRRAVALDGEGVAGIACRTARGEGCVEASLHIASAFHDGLRGAAAFAMCLFAPALRYALRRNEGVQRWWRRAPTTNVRQRIHFKRHFDGQFSFARTFLFHNRSPFASCARAPPPREVKPGPVQ